MRKAKTLRDKRCCKEIIRLSAELSRDKRIDKRNRRRRNEKRREQYVGVFELAKRGRYGGHRGGKQQRCDESGSRNEGGRPSDGKRKDDGCGKSSGINLTFTA